MTKNEKNKQFVEDVDKMTVNILMQIDEMITEEDCANFVELTDGNATEFFTALNNAVCHKLIKVGMADNFLKAQHVYNNLLFQYLLRKNAKA